MKATASRDKDSRTALMAPTSEKIVDSVLTIMQHFGLKRIECRKIRSAQYERLVAVSEPFAGTPDDVQSCGILIRDALACILAATGVLGVSIESTEDEDRQMAEGYGKLIELRDAVKAASEGSSDIPKGAKCKTAKCGKKCPKKSARRRS